MKFYTSLATLLAFSAAAIAQQLTPGTYRITPTIAPDSALTAPVRKNQPAFVAPITNEANQLWTLTAVPNLGAGNFTFQNVGTEEWLRAPEFRVPGTTVLCSEDRPSNWFTKPNADSWRIFINIGLAVNFHDTSNTGAGRQAELELRARRIRVTLPCRRTRASFGIGAQLSLFRSAVWCSCAGACAVFLQRPEVQIVTETVPHAKPSLCQRGLRRVNENQGGQNTMSAERACICKLPSGVTTSDTRRASRNRP
ncbi:hypothetical protein AURDEDRAFT_125801 [Auricularia subglabra TFB-10046 SS5]|nr:hypothetical protein AURDEDRAFT_125801 [Auricularia subglabra TFB-10046 SS5]